MFLELHDTARDHPKLLKVSRDLGLSQVVTLGHVTSLWLWVLRMAPDGDLSSFDIDDIEIGAMWGGEPGAFVASLVDRKLLDDVEGALRVHDWEDYAQHLKAAERKRNERKRKAAAKQHESREVTERHVTSCDRGGFSGPVTLNRTEPTRTEPTRTDVTAPSASQNEASAPELRKPEILASPIVATIPLASGEEHPVSRSDVAGWSRSFPAVDVMQSLRTMREWCLANPARRKTKRGVRQFIVGWLTRDQDRGGARAPPAPNASAMSKQERGMRAAFAAVEAYNAQCEDQQ